MDRHTDRVDTDEMNESDNDHRNKSILLQLADVEYKTFDDNSQDLFNDDSSAQNSPSINFNESYQTIRAHSSFNADLANSLAHTPNIRNHDGHWSITHPSVPTVPMSLLPFISTVNESWNSELETPTAKIVPKTTLEHAETAGQEQFSKSFGSAERKSGSSVRSSRNGVVPEIKTPSGCFVVGMEDERLRTSPLLTKATNRRRRPKRRILQSLGDNTAPADSPKKNVEATERPLERKESFGSKAVKNEETLAESSASDINNATFVMDDISTSTHNSNIRLLEEELNPNLDEKKCLRNEQNDQFSPMKPAEIPTVKENWGFMTFTELCLREEEYCENRDSKETEDRPISSSLQEGVDLSSQEDKNIPKSSSLGKDEPPIDIADFNPWLYQSDEQKVGSSDRDVTKKLTKENIKRSETETRQQIPIAEEVAGVMKDESIHSFGLLKEKEQTANSSSSIGFFTAGGAPIKISEEKLKNAQKLYNEISLQDGMPNSAISSTCKIVGTDRLKTYKTEATILQNCYSSIGFSTASGIPIKVSEEKLKVAEKMYQEIDSIDKLPLAVKSSSNMSVPRGIKRQRESHGAGSSLGFTAASGKLSVIDKVTIKKARIIYEREGRLINSENIQKTKSSEKSSLIAANKDTINTGALQGRLATDADDKSTSDDGNVARLLRRKADNLINELSQTDHHNYAISKRSKMLTEEEEISLKNFDSIHRPISTGFSDSTPLEDQTICGANISTCNSVSPVPKIVGFSTANGDRINISDQALLKAKILFAEEPTALKSSPLINRLMGSKDVVGFSTANRKLMKISGDALLKERKSLETEQENTPPRSAANSISSDETPVGSSLFQTSKRVGVNSDFNLQARKLFSEEDCEPDGCHAENSRKIAAGIKAKREMFGANDRHMTPKLEPQKCWPLKQDKDAAEFGAGFNNEDERRLPQTPKDKRTFTYSEEITASTEALLADEQNSLHGKSWASGIACTSAAIEDRDISARPITLEAEDVREIPTSPILVSKITADRKNRRDKKRIGSKQLKPNRDNETIQDQISTQELHCSSSTTKTNSDTLKRSPKNMSSLIETVSESKVEIFEGICSTRAQSSDSRSGTQLEVNFAEMDDNFFEERVAATLEQEKRIRTKKRFKPKPIMGSLLLRRMNNKGSRVSWREATSGVLPVPKNSNELRNLGIATDAMEITAATALSYKFKCSDFYSKNEICSNPRGLDVGDGFRLIFDDNGYAGTAEFEQSFLAGPGVDPNLVPEKWVGNHYRWIVWKLASMDRMKFGDSVMPRMLTPRYVMEQLKYRHDREIDRSERPALRRIIEKDDPPCRRMVLCVATITKLEEIQGLVKSPKLPLMSHWKMELTDGWYSIPATIDSAMANLIAFGKVREGTKLVTSRAELLNCDEGCSPLEIPGDVSLKIHTNSTRRSRWDAKLGYCKYSSPIRTSLSSVLPNGGLIGKLDTTIARVYPNQFYEKTWSGQPIFRNSKCEDKVAMKYEEERQAQLESICAKAQADFEARNLRHSKSYSAAFSNSRDPDSYQACYSGEEHMSSRSYNEASESQDFQKELESIVRQGLPPPRKVTLILKVRLMGGDNPAILTVWAPNEDTVDLIKEGNRVSFHNVQTSGKRSGNLQLTAGHQSFVKLERSNASPFPQRRLTPIPEVGVPGFNPPFGEFDTVGIVVSLGPAPYGMKNFEVVDLAYPPSSEAPGGSAYLSILFWEGIGTHGFSDILTVGSIVACNNLQWRRGAPRTIPLAYSTEHSSFTRNPRQNNLRSAFELVKNRITDSIAFVSQCAVEIALERQKKSTIVRSPAVHGTPSNVSPSAASFQDRFAPGMSPQTAQGPPNLAKDCTPAKYSIQRRLEKLQWYGEPPELSPITLKHSSSKLNQRFIPPVRTPEH